MTSNEQIKVDGIGVGMEWLIPFLPFKQRYPNYFLPQLMMQERKVTGKDYLMVTILMPHPDLGHVKRSLLHIERLGY